MIQSPLTLEPFAAQSFRFVHCLDNVRSILDDNGVLVVPALQVRLGTAFVIHHLKFVGSENDQIRRTVSAKLRLYSEIGLSNFEHLLNEFGFVLFRI